MLSGFSQFLFGGSDRPESVPLNSICNDQEEILATSPVENEWILVDSAGGGAFRSRLNSDVEPTSDTELGECGADDGLITIIPSDAESLPTSETSTPAKSNFSVLSSGRSGSSTSGSLDEPSDFERFRGPYLSTRELLNEVGYERPPSSEMGALSDVSSQPEHLEHPSVDECWIVTPPPCFVSSHRVEVTTSPLENLLIEHPSMSVYHLSHRLARRQPNRLRQHVVPPVVDAVMPPPPPPPVGPPTGAVARHPIPPRLHVPPTVPSVPLACRAVGARLRLDNSRRTIDRCNRVASTAVNGGICRRRQHRAVRNSGKNNDRHCQ